MHYKGMSELQYVECAQELSEAIKNVVEMQSRLLLAFSAESQSFQHSMKAAKALHYLRRELEQRAFDQEVMLSSTDLWKHGELIY